MNHVPSWAIEIRAPWLFRIYREWNPTHVMWGLYGIIMNHYMDPYLTKRILWNVTGVFFFRGPVVELFHWHWSVYPERAGYVTRLNTPSHLENHLPVGMYSLRLVRKYNRGVWMAVSFTLFYVCTTCRSIYPFIHLSIHLSIHHIYPSHLSIPSIPSIYLIHLFDLSICFFNTWQDGPVWLGRYFLVFSVSGEKPTIQPDQLGQHLIV